MIAAPRLDVGIGRGDDAPAIVWTMPFPVAGSDFALAITVAGAPATLGMPAGLLTVTTYTVSGGGLVLDPVANTVMWSPTQAESAALPPASAYTLRRTVPEVRYYAWGSLYGLDGPVGATGVTVTEGTPWQPDAASLDLGIARGDDAPSPMWVFPFDITGSVFVLSVETPTGPVILSSVDCGLVVDSVASTVTWPITSAQSTTLGDSNPYTLRRVSPEVRYYASGLILSADGPVRVNAVVVVTEGPQGVPGRDGAAAPIYTAAATISGDKALMFAGPGNVVPADPTAQSYIYAGLALSAAQPGGTVSAVTFGDAFASFWSWSPMSPIFVAPGGNLTQTPPTSGRSHLIGWALDAQTIHLAPDPIITFV